MWPRQPSDALCKCSDNLGADVASVLAMPTGGDICLYKEVTLLVQVGWKSPGFTGHILKNSNIKFQLSSH